MAAFAAGFVIAQVLFFGWILVLIRRDEGADTSRGAPIVRVSISGRRFQAALAQVAERLAKATPAWGFEPSSLAAYGLPSDYVAMTDGETVEENDGAGADHTARVPHAA